MVCFQDEQIKRLKLSLELGQTSVELTEIVIRLVELEIEVSRLSKENQEIKARLVAHGL